MNTGESIEERSAVHIKPTTGRPHNISHYRLVWCGVLDSGQATIAAGAQRVLHEICGIDGPRNVRLPRLLAAVLKALKPESIRGVSPARFDGALDYGFLVLQNQEEAERLARLLFKFSQAVARRRPLSFGYLSLDIEASEWQAPVDTPLHVPVAGEVLFAVQIRSRGGEVVVDRRVAKSGETSATVPGVDSQARWVC